MRDTIRPVDIRTGDAPKNSSAQENISSSRSTTGQLFLSGENSGTIADKLASIARFSEMNHKYYRVTLSERLTPLLISAGLANGTTRMFGRRLLNRGILAGVSYAPDGTVVDIQNQGLLFWSATNE